MQSTRAPRAPELWAAAKVCLPGCMLAQIQSSDICLHVTCKRYLRGAQGLLRALQHGQHGRRQALRLRLRPLGGGRQLSALLIGNLLPKMCSCIVGIVLNYSYTPSTPSMTALI